MKTHCPRKNRPARGYALLMTLTFLAVALISFASIMHWVSSSSMVTERNNLYVSAQAAAESATENALATMMRDFTYNTLKSADTYAAMVPNTAGWPAAFTFADTNGTAGRTSVQIGSEVWSQLPSQFKGLYGYGHDCVIASRATTKGSSYDVSSTVAQSVWFGNIPLFQFAIFYNMDMEINPGGKMTVNGRVHSNYNIWATGSSSGSPLTFTASVDASGLVTNTPSPLDPQNYGRRSGNGVYNDPGSPVPNADSLTLPIGEDGNNNPTNITSILSLPPGNMMAPNPAAYSPDGQTYLYNEADLVISNSPAGINGNSSSDAMTVYYQNPNLVNPLVKVTPDVQKVQTLTSNAYAISTAYVTNLIPVTTYTTNYIYYTSGKRKGQIRSTQVISHTTYTPEVVAQTVTNVTTSYVTITNFYYSFVTNQTFYDYREQKTVQAVQVDIAGLNAWLNNNSTTGGQQYDQINTTGSTDKGHDINSIYVYNNTANDNSTLPAVRLVNGQQLPSSGLTVATPQPLYVQGDYNTTTDGSHFSASLGDTTHTRPAALLGDAITILSKNWKDSYGPGTSLNNRSPVSTCINAATLEGIVPSDGSHYSGGVENFLRLLEDWSGKTLTYNGSIVVMFPSQYATTPWGGGYYSVPTRNWGFDTNFEDSNKLPPMTPQLKATVRGAYVAR
jgi:hypothetical protein